MNAGSGFLISVVFVVLPMAEPKPPNVAEPVTAVLPNVGVALVDEADPPNGEEPKAGAGVTALPLGLVPKMFVVGAAGAEFTPNRFVLAALLLLPKAGAGGEVVFVEPEGTT